MKKHGYLAALVFGLAVVVGVSIASSQTTAPGRQAWEYMLVE